MVHNCHHGTAPTYLRALADLGLDVDPDADLSSARESDVVRYDSRPETVACGFTATMSRADKAKLGNLWSSVAFERDLVWAIENGFLIKPEGRTVRLPELDRLASLPTVAGDYKANDLDDVMRSSVDTTVDAILTHTAGRAMIVFAASVEHADDLADGLNSVGIKAAAVVGSHSRAEREESYTAYRNGELDALVTVQVLTEGADFPRCDTVVLARPTRSQVLFSQIVGRALRPYTDPLTGKVKDSALVLDLTGVVRDQKLRTLTDLWGEAETREFDGEGEEIPPPPPEPAPVAPTREREGRADLEAVDLFGDEKVLILRSRAGVVYVPGGINFGRQAFALWPPNPSEAEKVYLLHITPKGGMEVWRGSDGQPIHGQWTQALEAACKAAQAANSFISPSASWRRGAVRPSSGQKSLAGNLGIPITASMSKAEVSDAITSSFLDRTLRKHLPALTSMGLY